MRSAKAFTLIELLIVIAIVGILAAVLIPNLLNARARAFDTATVSCLKELATTQNAIATEQPFEYDPGLNPNTLPVCDGVVFTVSNVTASTFEYEAQHTNGRTTYRVEEATAVLPVP